MNTNDIEIQVYVGTKAFAVGKKDDWLDIIVDPAGLAAMGKIQNSINKDLSGVLRLNTSWNNDEQGYVRDEITALTLSKYPIGAESVRLTAQEIEQVIKTALERLKTSQEQQKQRDDTRKEREEAERTKMEAYVKSLANARELLKDELMAKDTEIERLKKLRDEWYKAATANEVTVRQKIVEDGSFEIEEEHTVTYKVVKEEDCE